MATSWFSKMVTDEGVTSSIGAVSASDDWLAKAQKKRRSSLLMIKPGLN
jgi:hypothetical protein